MADPGFIATPQWALIFAIHSAGVKGMTKVLQRGLRAEHLGDPHDPAVKVFKLFQRFYERGSLPTFPEIKLRAGIPLDGADPKAFNLDEAVDYMADAVMFREMKEGIGKALKVMKGNVREGHKALTDVVASASRWTRKSAMRSTNDPEWIADMYERFLKAANRLPGVLLGLPFPWPSLNDISQGLQKGEMTVVLAKRKVGKCVAAGTLLRRPETGELIPVEDFVRERRGKIHTWEPYETLHSVVPAAYVDTGSKECLEIIWRSGRRLVVTPEHPLKTPTGWRRADEIQVGNHTAAVSYIPEPEETKVWPDAECVFLGHMIAEGGCTKSSTPTYTKQDKAIRDDFEASLVHLACSLKPVKDKPGNYYVVGDGKVNGAARLLRDLDVMGCKSVDKVLPTSVFSLDNRQLGLLLGRMWSCDGSVEASGRVSYSTGSKALARQVQHLLLRFGVRSRMRTNKRVVMGGSRDYYEVGIYREDIDKFRRGVPLIGARAELLRAISFQGRSRIGWLKNEEIRAVVDAEIYDRPDLLQAVGHRLGYKFRFQRGHLFDSKSGRVRRKVFRAFCDVYKSALTWVLDEGIDWDEIVSVNPAGVHRVFDLSVARTHCFVANDVIVHNTWATFAICDHILKTVAKPSDRILYVSPEMTEPLVMSRWTAVNLSLDYALFRKGKLEKSERERLDNYALTPVTEAAASVKWLYGKDMPNKSVRDIVAAVQEVDPLLVVVDSLYVLGDRRRKIYERTLETIELLALDLASDCEVPVLCTSQLSGKTEKGATNADADAAAYAKALGDYADAVLGIFVPPENPDTRILRGMEAREYQPLDLRINFDLKTMNFDEIEVIIEESPDSTVQQGGGDAAVDAGMIQEDAIKF